MNFFFYFCLTEAHEMIKQNIVYEASPLDNHISYLMCPGKTAVRVETTKYPVSSYSRLSEKRIRSRNLGHKLFFNIYHMWYT